MEAIIWFYTRGIIEPDNLTEEQFIKYWSRLEYILWDDQEKKIVLR